MRVAIGELKHEANTFVPRLTTLDDFRAWHLWEGEAVIVNSRGTNVEVAGFLDVLEEAGAEVLPTLATFALSGGPLDTATYVTLRDRLLERLAAVRPFDAVLLALHGAMVTEEEEDADGVTIRAVRDVIGPDTPLVVSMDLHANLTAHCVEHADAIVGFRTSPHVDLRETGQRAARLLVKRLRSEARPVMAFAKLPMLTPASTHIHHLPGPFKRLMDAAKAAEGGAVLSASVFAVQPWLDVAEMGFATVTVTDGDPALAAETACRLAEQAWSERNAFMETRLAPPGEAIQRALAHPSGPVVLSDLADGTGAGSPGDATAVIAALLDADPPKPALVCVRDPAVAAAAEAVGVGTEIDVPVGGKLDNVYNRPVRFHGTVEFAGPAAFRFGGAGYTGVEMDMGRCTVLRWHNVRLLVTSTAVFTVDPAMYRAVGLEPADAQIVVVKSHIQFRAGYDDLAAEIILLDSPGMSSDHLDALDWRRLPRPIFPLDRVDAYTCRPVVCHRSDRARA
jgi:microcystin degradation protein MlrC